MICLLLAALDQTAVIPAVPAMSRDLHAYGQLSWIVAAYFITSTISTPVYAKLSDIYGRRRLLIACLLAFIVTSMMCGAAQTLGQLILFRALQGLGGGGLMALTQAAIADVVSPRERGRYQGYISAVWATASLSGPIVGGLVAQTVSWRWIFWVNLPIGAAAVWVCQKGLRRLPIPTHSRKPRIDVLGMTLFTAALSAALLALGWGGSVFAWESRQIFGLVASGIVLLALLVFQERRVADPLLPPSVFASTSYVSNIVVSTLASFLVFMCLFTIPLYFQMARGTTATQSGIYVAPFMLSSALGNILGSKWGQHFGTMRGGMRIAGAMAFCGLTWLAALPIDAPLWMVMVGMLVTGPGVGVSLIGSMTCAQNALRSDDIGSGTGALLVLRSVGGASGSTLAGVVITAGATGAHAHNGASLAHDFQWAYGTAAGFAALLFIVTLLMPDTPLRSNIHSFQVSD
jgi:EmrB/QacA subfamily drug resistance transporter